MLTYHSQLKSQVNLDYQREIMRDLRRSDRTNAPTSIKYNLSRADDVDPFFHLMDDPNTVFEGIEGLYNFCEKSVVVITFQQSFVLLKAMKSNNPEIIEKSLILIEKILMFNEEFNTEIFSQQEFISVFLNYLHSIHSINSLIIIIKSNVQSAKYILDRFKEFPIKSLLKKNAYNLEINIHFLSSFAVHEEKHCIEFLSGFLPKIFKLARSGLRPSVRFTCLEFIFNLISVNKALIQKIAYHSQLITVFQSPPSCPQERILELRILRQLASQTHDSLTVIVSNNLLPFVLFCASLSFNNKNIINNSNHHVNNECEDTLNNILNTFSLGDNSSLCDSVCTSASDFDHECYDNVSACYSIDILGEIAACGNDGVNILSQNGVDDLLMNILHSKKQFDMMICAICAILEIIKHSTSEHIDFYLRNNFFDIVGQIYESIPDDALERITVLIYQIIQKGMIENNSQLLKAMFTATLLIESIEFLIHNETYPISSISTEIVAIANNFFENSP
ncbi:hypothetical protein TRFO_10232 [Tritrichomonas foetus]|uniref:Uncharacterized protein n=1 Tax=Tritrichomonas foetus TaxID=1144522 RepID=A0A1J4JCR6_9EUKA|nr:hypothetical protein TRFO_10232 [Tritrichomonas foetus]|eukprot:OHS96047.1 hypothetical protein TRFO_10232 [Tritrichomonas foetus]